MSIPLFYNIVKNQGEKNVYVSRILINGKEVKDNTLAHETLTNGGTIIFEMTSKKPKK